MYVCVCEREKKMYVYVRIYACVYVYVCINVSACVYVYIYMYICVCVCVCVRASIIPSGFTIEQWENLLFIVTRKKSIEHLYLFNYIITISLTWFSFQ